MTMPLRHWALAALLAVRDDSDCHGKVDDPQRTGVYTSVSGLYVIAETIRRSNTATMSCVYSGDLAMEEGFGVLAAVGYSKKLPTGGRNSGAKSRLGYRAFDIRQGKELESSALLSEQLEIPR